MFDKDKKISAWQTGILLFVLLFANKILVLPSVIETKSKIEAVLLVASIFVLEIGLLILFWCTKSRHPDRSFFDVLKIKCGSVVCKIICLLACLYFLSKAVLLYNVMHDFLRNLVYKDVSDILFLVAILPVANFLAFSGITAHARTMQLFFPFILLSVLFCLVVGAFQIDKNLILYGIDAESFFVNALKYIGVFGDSIFLFVIMDKVSIQKGRWKVVFSLAGAGMFLCLAVTAVFVFSFTYTSFLHPFALFELLSYVKEYEGLGRIDIIPVIVVMFLAFYQLGIYFYAMTTCLNNVFIKAKKEYLLAIIDVVFVLLVVCVVTGLAQTCWLGKILSPYVSAVAFIVFPIVALIVNLRRRA